MERRDFLKAMLAGSALLALPNASQAFMVSNQDDLAGTESLGLGSFWDRPRTLWMQRTTTGEVIRANYWENGSMNREGYIQCCQLLRDVRASQTVQMDMQLLNLLYGIQGWLALNNVQLPIMVHSGYRTVGTNANIEGAAKNSMHLYGKAVDLHFPNVPSRYLAELSTRFQGGGVGFYPDKGFVHVDTGRIRQWRG